MSLLSDDINALLVPMTEYVHWKRTCESLPLIQEWFARIKDELGAHRANAHEQLTDRLFKKLHSSRYLKQKEVSFFGVPVWKRQRNFVKELEGVLLATESIVL